MSVRGMFTDAEWGTLEKAPIWAFILTSAADGRVDRKEAKAFAKELSETVLYKDELARDVFTSTMSQFEELLSSCAKAPADAVAGLRSAGSIVDAKYGQRANDFKLAVLYVCEKVATASGGLFGLRSRVSDDERAALGIVAGALGAEVGT